jgi:N-acetylmuramoyl-L-alanine amidase
MATSQRKFVRRLRRVYGVKVLTRRQWGTEHPLLYGLRVITHPAKVPSDTLVQHITVTFDSGKLTGDMVKDMQTLERIGYSRFRSGISYNGAVDREGALGIGQNLRAKGTHTVNHKRVPNYSYDQNYWARAIAWIGVEGDRPTEACVETTAKFFACLMDCGHLTEDPDYDPHAKFTAKSCPTPAMISRMPEIRRRAYALHDKNKDVPTPTARRKVRDRRK